MKGLRYASEVVDKSPVKVAKPNKDLNIAKGLRGVIAPIRDRLNT